MSYPANLLITNAYFESGIVAKNYETPTGQQISDGLNYLNDVIGDMTMKNDLIPFITKYPFTATPGDPEYFIPNLVSIETFTFFINSIRYNTMNQDFKKFHGSFQATDVKSLPYKWNARKELGGMVLSLYFVPDTNYQLEIYGEFSLSEVTLFEDLSLTFERYYINYLKYYLASRLCSLYQVSEPVTVTSELSKYEKAIKEKVSAMDLTTQIISPFSGGSGSINYFALLGQGYAPPDWIDG